MNGPRHYLMMIFDIVVSVIILLFELAGETVSDVTVVDCAADYENESASATAHPNIDLVLIRISNSKPSFILHVSYFLNLNPFVFPVFHLRYLLCLL